MLEAPSAIKFIRCFPSFIWRQEGTISMLIVRSLSTVITS